MSSKIRSEIQSKIQSKIRSEIQSKIQSKIRSEILKPTCWLQTYALSSQVYFWFSSQSLHFVTILTFTFGDRVPSPLKEKIPKTSRCSLNLSQNGRERLQIKWNGIPKLIWQIYKSFWSWYDMVVPVKIELNNFIFFTSITSIDKKFSSKFTTKRQLIPSVCFCDNTRKTWFVCS